MKTYEAIFNEDQTTGVYGISLVKKPAMEGTFIALSKQEPIQFKTVDAEQQIIVGLVLQPNKMIYRFDEKTKEEYNLFFGEQTVTNLAHNFFKQKFNSNSTIEHNPNNKVKSLSFVESWIVEDVKLDKQQLYGFNYPKGSWLIKGKIYDKTEWDEYVKTGLVEGLSIDGLLDLKEVNLNKNTNKMTEILTEIKDLIKTSFSKKEAIKLGEVMTADGQVKIEYEGEEMQVGANAWITAEDGTQIPVPVGEHPLENGMVLIVVEEGIIGEVKEIAEAPAEEPAPVEPVSQTANKDAEMTQEIANAIKSIVIKYSEIENTVNEIKAQLSEVIKENKELKLALSETPAVKKVNAVPTQVDLSKMNELEKRRWYRENGY